MAKDYSRVDRVADFLKRELSQLIQFQIRDPRIGMVSVNDVEVSRDIAYARVFVTSLDAQEDEAQQQEIIDVLNKASGFLRSHLAKATTMRTTPKLKFIFDTSVARGQHISSLIEKAVKADQSSAGNDD